MVGKLFDEEPSARLLAESVGEVRQYIEHPCSGYLVPPGDEDAFVAGVIRLPRREPLRLTRGKGATRRVRENISWSGLNKVVKGAYAG